MTSISALLQAAQSHLQARELGKAESICHHILRLDNRQAETMQVLALALFYRGENDSAIQWLRKAILIRPEAHQFYSILGTIFGATREFAEAVRYHRRAAEIEPNNPDYLSNAGLALMNIGQPEPAVALFRSALAIRPQHFIARSNLGLALQAAGNFDEAIEAFQEVVTQKPDHMAAWSNLAGAFSNRGDVALAIEASRKAVALSPSDFAANHCLLMTLSYSPSLRTKEIAQEHVNWGRRCADPVEAGDSTARLSPTPCARDKLRIGYVSTDFHRHPVVHFFEPLLMHHDRNEFEIFCYSSSSTVDDVTRTLRGYQNQWRDILPLTHDQAAALIRRDEIDLLVDLNGHTAGSRLIVFAHRPAPVQMTYLGYNGTTGMRQIDYFLTDSVLDQPGDEQYYTEKLLRLPQTFACYRPYLDAPDVISRPGGGGITFISQHPLIRLNKVVVQLWATILRQIPDSRLIIARHTLTAVAEQNLFEEFELHGITRPRLEMRKTHSSPHHLRNYHDADIALDTTPWSGHTTACEALWMGCPVVTLYGSSHAGRRVASVLTQLGLTDHITYSPEEYVDAVVRLAKDVTKRATLRANLREIMRTSPLMDAARFTQNLETAYKSVFAARMANK